MQRTSAVLQEMERILRKNPLVDRVLMVAGFQLRGPGGERRPGVHPAQGLERAHPAQRGDQGLHPGGQCGAAGGAGGADLRGQHATVRGLGRFGGFDFRLQDRAVSAMSRCCRHATPCWVPPPRTRSWPGCGPINWKTPQVRLTVDRLQAKPWGWISPTSTHRHPAHAGPGLCQRLQLPGAGPEGLLQADADFPQPPGGPDPLFHPEQPGRLDAMCP